VLPGLGDCHGTVGCSLGSGRADNVLFNFIFVQINKSLTLLDILPL
jgi:hypothetical protein